MNEEIPEGDARDAFESRQAVVIMRMREELGYVSTEPPPFAYWVIKRLARLEILAEDNNR